MGGSKHQEHSMIDYTHIFVKIYFKVVRMSQLFYINKKENDILIICIYVDDIIYMGSSQYLIYEFKLSMMSKFDMKNLGILDYFLGLKDYPSDHDIFISKKKICWISSKSSSC